MYNILYCIVVIQTNLDDTHQYIDYILFKNEKQRLFIVRQGFLNINPSKKLQNEFQLRW